MPKKDTAVAVLGMLSETGAQTRPVHDDPVAHRTRLPEPTREDTAATAPAHVRSEPNSRAAAPPARPATPVNGVEAVSTSNPAASAAPPTTRLHPQTAAALRAAWLEAKRDDVLLTAVDFASKLVDDALAARKRARRR